MSDVDRYHREISAKGYGQLRPGLEDQPFGRGFRVWDPFGNRIRFHRPKTD